MDNQKTTKTACEISKTIVNIPVTVSLLVPIEIDHDVVEPIEKDELLDIAVLEIGEMEDGSDILDKTVEAMRNSKVAEDALIHLLAGAHEFKKIHPEVVGKYSIFLGVAREETF